MKTLALLAAALLVGCGGGSVATPAGTPAATVHLTAAGMAFIDRQLSVPADAPFAIEFENRDGLPHNVAIDGATSPANDVAFSGPATRTLIFAGLPAGSYRFACAVHPEMTGTLEATDQAQAGR